MKQTLKDFIINFFDYKRFDLYKKEYIEEFSNDIVTAILNEFPEETPEIGCFKDNEDKKDWWMENRGNDNQDYNNGFEDALLKVKQLIDDE